MGTGADGEPEIVTELEPDFFSAFFHGNCSGGVFYLIFFLRRCPGGGDCFRGFDLVIGAFSEFYLGDIHCWIWCLI